VLETLIGGIEPKSKRPFRPELGETVVAYGPRGQHDVARCCRPARASFATPTRVDRLRRRSGPPRLRAVNAAARAARRAESAAYWRNAAPPPAPGSPPRPRWRCPRCPPAFPAHNAIDHFIAARIAKVSAEHAPERKRAGSISTAT
jgi:hypothetical protein